MQIKLYLDEDVHPGLAPVLRERGYDVVSAREVERLRFSDAQQLAFAIHQQRTILTYNTQDYVPLHVEYIMASRKHYGIVVSPQLSFSNTLHRVIRLLSNLTAEDMVNQLEYLSNWR